MADIYNFPDNEDGAKQREEFISAVVSVGFTARKFEEVLTVGEWTVRLLKVELSKRPGEGQIAADIKKRKNQY